MKYRFVFSAFLLIFSYSILAQSENSKWTWMNGDTLVPIKPVYGNIEMADGTSDPGLQSGAPHWTDADGNLWLYSAAKIMWKYVSATDSWVWVSGNNLSTDVSGVYGSKGVSNSANLPGSRFNAATWTDASGNFWLFGGKGYDAAGNSGFLNDLWKFTIATGQWTWMHGDNSILQSGIYGTRKIAAASNLPGARENAAVAKDAAGNLWLFGGLGKDGSSTGNLLLNDLWKYDPSANQWTWISGNTTSNQNTVYGSKGIPSSTNKPGGKALASAWTDASGNFWAFGGSSNEGIMNDLWKYDLVLDQWIWMNGSNVSYSAGDYGLRGVSSPTSSPPSRIYQASWKDALGNFWVFGGIGLGTMNDLWKYTPAANEWTWVSGSNTTLGIGSYGTMGVTAPGNRPGARHSLLSWKDNGGNLLLFGGQGIDGRGNNANLNDIWRFDVSTNQWTWLRGKDVYVLPSVYGTKGSATTLTKPTKRFNAASVSFETTTFWLFGGDGVDKDGYSGSMNDLWRYDVNADRWTWISGDNTVKSAGSYGTKGIANPSNKPGARLAAAMWSDMTGNLWLFGGYGYDKNGSQGGLNDLWKFDVTTNEWTWMSGDDIISQTGAYGSMGIGDINNKPGARRSMAYWKDNSDNLWVFGGSAFFGNYPGSLNDLWKYSPSTNQWTWMGGDNTLNQPGVYGTKGVADAGNKPGARRFTVASGSTDKVWLFGGNGFDATGKYGNLNDLWSYDIASNQWTWIFGDKLVNQLGNYGTKGVADAANSPRGLMDAVSWMDASGNFWLYGGAGSSMANAMTPYMYSNDLWKFNSGTGQWTWVSGSQSSFAQPVYGNIKMPAASNDPGARTTAASWVTPGALWLYSGYMNGELWRFADEPKFLPLHWINFSAQKQGKATLLTWETANEQNTKAFITERSENGIKYDSIGTVKAQSSGYGSRTTYLFTDSNPFNGRNYYRIKQMDIDGRHSYSTMRIVAFGEELEIVWSNAGSTINVSLKGGGTEPYFLYDTNGKLVKSGNLLNGAASFHQLNSGVYIINISSRQKVYSAKIVAR